MIKIELNKKELISFQYLTKEEILKSCKEKGLVYLGKGKVISKKDLTTIRTYIDAVRYGDNIE